MAPHPVLFITAEDRAVTSFLATFEFVGTPFALTSPDYWRARYLAFLSPKGRGINPFGGDDSFPQQGEVR
jgi:hypothetical protein